MAGYKRFETIDKQGSGFSNYYAEVVDTKTGVHYLVWNSGYAGSITPLLGPDGKPVVSARGVEYEV